MAIDAYSLCPGGTGKKIKFCCSDFLPELEKIGRMIEGEQVLACIQHIERLLQQGQKRQCLMALRTLLLRAANQTDAAIAQVDEFLREYPNNAVAWGESALLAAEQNGRVAMQKLQRAIALSNDQLHSSVYEAMDAVADALAEDGDWFAARALWRVQAMIAPEDDPHPMQQLMALNRSAEIPLLMKLEPAPLPVADDAPWRERFEAALANLPRAHWQEVTDKLTALAQEVPDAAPVWQNLAVVRSWLADDEGAIEAWRKYASLATPQETASEAEALAMMFSSDPLGDAVDSLRWVWPVRDAERLHEALLSDRRVAPVPFDPANFPSEAGPPPRMVALLLDRPVPESIESITVNDMPRILGQAMLFGRQTDREARLEVQGLIAPDAPAAKDLLRHLGGENLGPEPQEEVMGKSSGSHQLLSHRWYAVRGLPPERTAALAAEHRREALLERWPRLPLGILGGRTPSEAAADPANHVRLLAAILVLAHWSERTPGEFDFNELRNRLGLPVLGPLELAPGEIESLPLVRLERVVAEKLSDDDLLAGFRRASLFRAWNAVRKFAQAIIDRPSMADRPERLNAYTMLAQSAENAEEAIRNIDAGRQVAQAAGKSCASWDLLELSYRFAGGDVENAMRLIHHVEHKHLQEPGIAQALAQMLMEVGLLRPDGTPAIPVPPGGAAAEPAVPAAEPGRLWTPDSETSGGGGGKLWTPE